MMSKIYHLVVDVYVTADSAEEANDKWGEFAVNAYAASKDASENSLSNSIQMQVDGEGATEDDPSNEELDD